MPVREPFNHEKPLVAARDFRFGGVEYKEGDSFPYDPAKRRLIQRQYEVRAIMHGEAQDSETDQEAELIQMTGPVGGRYTITAPWMEEPLVIRGKKKAEEALAELREEGPPEGWEPENGNEGAGEGEGAEGAENPNTDKSENETGGGGAAEGEGGASDPGAGEGAEGGADNGNPGDKTPPDA